MADKKKGDRIAHEQAKESCNGAESDCLRQHAPVIAVAEKADIRVGRQPGRRSEVLDALSIRGNAKKSSKKQREGAVHSQEGAVAALPNLLSCSVERTPRWRSRLLLGSHFLTPPLDPLAP